MEDTFRVRLHLPSAPGSGAALRQELRASSRRSHRPTGQSKRQKRTHDWIKLGGKVRGPVRATDLFIGAGFFCVTYLFSPMDMPLPSSPAAAPHCCKFSD